MAHAGEGYMVHFTGLTHDDRGYPAMNAQAHAEMVSRMTGKIPRNLDKIIQVQRYRLDDADVALISYGISSRSSFAAVDEARERGIKAGLLRLVTVWPFPEDAIRELAKTGEVFHNGRIESGANSPGGTKVRRRAWPLLSLWVMPEGPLSRRPEILEKIAEGSTLVRLDTIEDEFGRLKHPLDSLLRTDRIPHIWCPGCGIGTVFSSSLIAMKSSGVDLTKTARGIRDRVFGKRRRIRKARFLSHHSWPRHPVCDGHEACQPRTERGRLQRRRGPVCDRRQPFHSCRQAQHGPDGDMRQQLQLRNDGRAGRGDNPADGHDDDHAPWKPGARRSICPCWHTLRERPTLPLDHASHARSYPVDRGSPRRRGFSFIEVLAPCPTGYGRRNRQKPIDSLRFYQEKAIVRNGANPAEVILDFKQGITLGKFIEYDRPTFSEAYDKICRPASCLLSQGDLERRIIVHCEDSSDYSS